MGRRSGICDRQGQLRQMLAGRRSPRCLFAAACRLALLAAAVAAPAGGAPQAQPTAPHRRDGFAGAAGRERRLRLVPQLGTAVITSVGLSPDGKRVLTGGADGTARLWDAHTGQMVRSFAGHTARVAAVAFSPDGKYVLTGSDDTTARIWDPRPGAELCELLTFNDGTWAVADLNTGRYDASSGGNAKWLCWVIGNQPYDLSKFKSGRYAPGLLRRIWVGKPQHGVR